MKIFLVKIFFSEIFLVKIFSEIFLVKIFLEKIFFLERDITFPRTPYNPYIQLPPTLTPYLKLRGGRRMNKWTYGPDASTFCLFYNNRLNKCLNMVSPHEIETLACKNLVKITAKFCWPLLGPGPGWNLNWRINIFICSGRLSPGLRLQTKLKTVARILMDREERRILCVLNIKCGDGWDA